MLSDDKTFKAILTCIAAYFAVAVICFGPATLQSERAQVEYQAKCKAEGRSPCYFGPNPGDGFFKAAFWPLWLSYTVAKNLDSAEAKQ